MERNISIHISDRSHLNLTLNVYNCGNQDIVIEQEMKSDVYTIFFVREGKGYVTQQQITHKVSAGQGFVVFPNAETAIKSEFKNTMNVDWVAFSGYLVEKYLDRAHLTIFEPVFEDVKDRELEGYFDRLVDVSRHMPNRYCKLMAQLYSIFAFILDHTFVEKAPVSTPAEVFLLKALDFIDINYQSDISVEDIAQAAGCNRKTLYNVFKNLTGFSPRDYLIYYRMWKATVLLKNPRLSIEMVATAVGYGDQFHFSKEFKKNVGLPPSEYRKVINTDPSKEYQSPIDIVREHYPNPMADISSQS
ncbi:MAG: AraC family transcriptional regulator [Clostridia bacterium]|nr:AraC family transcriptional regulator [Clostridia bacterium]